MKLTSRIDRVAAWVLAVCFLIYVISGFDIQLRFLSPSITSLLHLKYLFIVTQLAFMYHTSFAIRLAIKRKKFWNVFGKGLWVLYILINLAMFYLYFAIHH